MAKLIYAMMISLDGYVAGPDGSIVGLIDEEVHTFANREAARIGTEHYGRRMYETMVYWETWEGEPDRPQYARDFANIWKGLDKIVFSSTLTNVSSRNTRIERRVDADAIRSLKEKSAKDISVSGPTLAARFIREGLVDEYGVYLTPVIVGGGTRYLGDIGLRLDLDLIEEHHFGNGVVFLRYRQRR